MNKQFACVTTLALAGCGVFTSGIEAGGTEAQPGIVICGTAENDLVRVIAQSGLEVRRFDSPIDAVQAAANGTGVLILGDGYPQKTTTIVPAVFDLATKKKLRLYVEFPASLPGVMVSQPGKTHIQRAVIASDFFGKNLKKLRILSINGLHYVSIKAEKSHIVAARVAGFDHAVYGLPKSYPILFEMPDRDVLVATTKLSHFVTGRYAPQDSWQNIWKAILTWLSPRVEIPPLRWTPTVRATYSRDQTLPKDYELQAIRRGVEWYKKANMIVHPSFEKQIVGINRVDSLPSGTPVGDGSLGSLEAVVSVIHQDGTQPLSSAQRGDCICETAMALALGGKVFRNKGDSEIARNLLDYYLFKSDARKREFGDPKHGAYGLIAWGITTPNWFKGNYGDDNARVILSTLAAAAVNRDDRWDEAMMMCLLANLRTTGQLGFRGSSIRTSALGGGWERFFHRNPVNFAPHFECYLWACYLWAYEQTGYEMFLDRAETGLKMTMAQYTDGWRWTNGLAQERARIVLPLAWLVRAKDTRENRAMLRKAVDGLIALQDECGAIREELGLPGRGINPPPRSNAAYGTGEASLIANNGDPVADLLYTTNFAFLGLHEAAAATGEKDIIEAENRLAEFLCRIQVRSEKLPQVDGGWFRAFDFKRWEHWGSNADHGWGAWTIESGWTQGWITSVLAMRQMKTSLWDLTHQSKIERHFDRLRKQMIPDEVLESPEMRAKKAGHAAVGKAIRLTTMANPLYRGLGARSLVDGKISDPNHASQLWLGFHGNDLDAVIDLGKPMPINRVGVRFLQSIAVGIYLPKKVVFEVSSDGKTFSPASSIELKHDPRVQDKRVHTVYTKKPLAASRYLRIRAVNVATILAGHQAAGQKAWLFADEILVNPIPTKPRDEDHP